VRFGLVVPRYGREVLGGTEHWLRALCEHLVAMRSWEVDVFTTCARSAATWADEYPPGTSVIEGVNVHRHRSVSGRNRAYLEMYPELHRDAESVSLEQARRFVELVGPVCPDVLDHAEESSCELIAVTPYLYWPAVVGVPRLGRRVLFHGATHDEPELYLPVMPAVFEAVGGFSYNSFAERNLVERTFRVRHLPSRVIGNAVVEGEGDQTAARAVLGVAQDEPFVLCIGKVEHAKGSHVLARMWRLYRRLRPAAPPLVLMGPVVDGLPSDDSVKVVGPQPEAVKWGALGACTFLISPSAWESFSLVVVEAWLAGKTVLVNRRCGPTVEHCTRSAGGLWFDQFGDFAAACDLLLDEHNLRDRLARAGEAYARKTFAWPVIVERYEQLADAVRARATPLV
jgi:glycosyltransferase involved in cell wall biosynthesis